MNRYIFMILLLIGFTQVALGDFNPDLPSEPEILKSVILKTEPSEIAFTIGEGNYGMGQSVYIYVPADYNNWSFKYWKNDKGIIISEYNNFMLEIGENTSLTAFYEFNPKLPSEPEIKTYHKVFLSSDPSGLCSFNIASGATLEENSQFNIFAYNINGYNLESWNIDGKIYPNDNPLYLTMGESNMNIIANLSFNPQTPNEPETASFYLLKGSNQIHSGNKSYYYVDFTSKGEAVRSLNFDIIFPYIFQIYPDDIIYPSGYNCYLHHVGNNKFNITIIPDSVTGEINNPEIIGISYQLADSIKNNFTYPVIIENGLVNNSISFPTINGSIHYYNEDINNQYNITTQVYGQGTVLGVDIYKHGDYYLLSAIPAEGYEFLYWVVNGNILADSSQIWEIANSDIHYQAYFEKIKYNLVVKHDSTMGNILINGNNDYGSRVTISSHPNDNMKFVCWMENGKIITTLPSYTFTLFSDREITALFSERERFNIEVSSNIDSAGFISGAGLYMENDYATLRAIPNDGYRFMRWTDGNLTFSTSTQYAFMVVDNKHITAEFEKDKIYDFDLSKNSIEYLLNDSIINDATSLIVSGDISGTDMEILSRLAQGGALSSLDLSETNGINNLNNVFSGNDGIVSLVLPASVGVVEEAAFAGCSQLTSIILSESLTVLSPRLFSGCEKLSDISIPENVEVISSGAFENCQSIKNIEFPTSVSELGSGAFAGCVSLKDVTLPIMVEELPSGLFANCESLEAIKIGIKTSSIDISAFEGCISLKTLFLNAIVPPSLVNRTPLQSKTLQRSSENINSLKDVDTETCILYVPMGTISTYRSSSVWGQFKNIVESGTCNITLNSSINNSCILSGNGDYDPDSDVIVKADPLYGFEFKYWTVNGGIISTDSIYSFNAESNINLTAVVERKRYSVSLTPDHDYKTGNVSGLGIYDYQTSVTLAAIPNDGYKFEKWVIDGNEYYDNILKIDLLKDLPVEALFSEILSINTGEAERINVYPTVTDDIINIIYPELCNIKVVDSYGNLILNLDVSGNYKLNLKEFRSGIYLLNIRTADNINEVVKVIRK